MGKNLYIKYLCARVELGARAFGAARMEYPAQLAAATLFRYSRAAFFLVTTAVFLAGLCAPVLTVAADRAPVKSLLEMRQDRVVVQKWDLSCGAAALATILHYQHDDPVPEREIAMTLMQRHEYLKHPVLVQIRQGFSLLDLKRYVDNRGYEGIGYGKLTVQDLIQYAPIMVPVNFHGYNHFVVFRGVHGEQVLLADPAWGNRTLGVEKFERAWIDYPQIGKVGFVVARRDGSAPPNRLAPQAKDFVLF